LFPTKKPDTTLEQMLDWAVEHVPYYKQFRGYKKITDFPLLTKSIIRREGKNLFSDDIDTRKWYYNTSGGSTGEPVRFVQDEEYSLRARWAVWETKKWAGYEPPQKLIKLWGSSSENQGYKSLKNKIALWLLNQIFLDTFSLNSELMEEYINIINQKKPKLVVGYASSLQQISQYAIENNIEIKNVGAIVSSAGTLYPKMRNIIEKAFQCKVYNRYGSREVHIIAAEDSSGQGLRITPMTHVEVLDADLSPCKTGQVGEIVVTSLANFAMPLIRYRIGDMGILKSCQETNYFRKVVGRTVEMFKTAEGEIIDGEYFTHLMYFRDWVRTFRFTQTDYKNIIIDVVLSADKPSKKELSLVEEGIMKKMGSDVTVEWRFIDDIPPLPSGKYIYTHTEIE